MIKNKYIAIEGAIGVGKTTLAKNISNTMKCQTLFEDFSDNPFLKNFYDNNQINSFSTQLYFLLRRIDQLVLLNTSSDMLVSDFYFGKDELFAKLNLSDIEYEMYTKIKSKLEFSPPIPDLIIYLQASTDILLNRIKKRDLIIEKNIKKKYIDSVNELYMKHFHEYKQSPVLIINTSNVNINNTDDYNLLIEEISSDIKGKKYFNPVSR
ncbi:MAG: deoxynucleoside kinase [Gammaproteobacteria bacterium]|nr:deoxynucleoside kinase [Gammaproteobacteria bacterium]MBL6819592.1 deoxynucleoside kinase [Gammaproteobacteria bacterium]